MQSDVLQGKIDPAEAAKQMQEIVSAWAKRLDACHGDHRHRDGRTPADARRKKTRHGGLIAWLFALPALVVYVVFLVYPALSSLWFSLTDWDGLSPTYNVVGLDNYPDMPDDPVVVQAAINNVIWTVVTIAVPVVIGLALAVLLNGKVRGKPVLRMIFYTPGRAAAGLDRLDLGLALQPRSTARSTRSCG